MARLISVDGAAFELSPGRKGKGFNKRELHSLVGPGIGIFVLNAATVMVVSLAAAKAGAALNARAVRILRRSILDPLALVYGPALVAGRNEIEFVKLVGRNFPP